MTDVFVVAPGDRTTGGPRLCHQLVHQLNSDVPGRAAVVYHPFDYRFKTPAPYRDYDAPVASRDEINPGAVVVLPEVYGHIVADFPDNDVYFWWLSVNFFQMAARLHADARQQLDEIGQHAAAHLYQSEYARRFIRSAGLGPATRLSDMLTENYLQAIAEPCGDVRGEMVVFNPAKGMSRTKLLLAALGKGIRSAPKMVPLAGMTPTQVELALEAAKVYVDFGNHPGKDRLPREAAAMGCCVVTNRRGAAANQVDVPIPGEFKLDDHKPRWERRAAGKVWQLMDDFDAQTRKFDPYRRLIAAEPAVFAQDVRAVFPARVMA